MDLSRPNFWKARTWWFSLIGGRMKQETSSRFNTRISCSGWSVSPLPSQLSRLMERKYFPTLTWGWGLCWHRLAPLGATAMKLKDSKLTSMLWWYSGFHTWKPRFIGLLSMEWVSLRRQHSKIKLRSSLSWSRTWRICSLGTPFQTSLATWFMRDPCSSYLMKSSCPKQNIKRRNLSTKSLQASSSWCVSWLKCRPSMWTNSWSRQRVTLSPAHCCESSMRWRFGTQMISLPSCCHKSRIFASF